MSAEFRLGHISVWENASWTLVIIFALWKTCIILLCLGRFLGLVWNFCCLKSNKCFLGPLRSLGPGTAALVAMKALSPSRRVEVMNGCSPRIELSEYRVLSREILNRFGLCRNFYPQNPPPFLHQWVEVDSYHNYILIIAITYSLL